MYKVSIKTGFSAAHRLRGYKGKCENIHGHNWIVEVTVASQVLDELGMVVDFKELKTMAESVINQLDHREMNELQYFIQNNPSAENIARYIYDSLEAEIQDRLSCKLVEVSVWENEHSKATYSREA